MVSYKDTEQESDLDEQVDVQERVLLRQDAKECKFLTSHCKMPQVRASRD